MPRDSQGANLVGFACFLISVPLVTRFDKNFHPGAWGIDVPRPTYAVWYGDTWHVSSQFTLNYGLRWDDDWAVAAPNSRH